MSQQLTELCTLLVDGTYGDLSAQIFATLAEHGRLTLPALAQLAQLPPRHLRHGLATLIQQHLLRHHTADDDGPTYYSVDYATAYSLVRTGRIVALVEDRHGDAAGHIISNLLQLGHAKVGDLADAYDLTPGSKRDSGIETCEEHINGEGIIRGMTNGLVHTTPQYGKISTVSAFHSTLRKLLRAGFLVKVGTRLFQPRSDLQEEVEEAVISDQFPDRRVIGTKKQQEFKRAVTGLKRKWRDADEYSDLHDIASRRTINRHTSHSKRVKLNGGLPNGVDHDEYDDAKEADSHTPKLPNDLVVRVSFAKCTVALRSQRLQHLATRFLGEVTGAVYGALLQSLETKIKAVRDDFATYDDSEDEVSAQPIASVIEVADLLDPAIDLASTIKGASSSKQPLNGVGKDNESAVFVDDDDDFRDIGIKKEHHSDDDDDPPHITGFTSYRAKSQRLNLIEQHLALLAEHSKLFCSRAGNLGRGEWRVNFPLLTNTLIQTELDTTITARFGKFSTRIVRMLRDKGKLEEKQVATCAMLKVKDVREKLTNLQSHGFVEAQELPKDNGRQPSRTLYLWYFDQKTAQNIVVQQCYQAMARALQRLGVERDRFKQVIEKAERLDVRGKEAGMLNKGEREQLRQWREIEERLLTQVGRMDDVVVLLRDFSGRDISLVC